MKYAQSGILIVWLVLALMRVGTCVASFGRSDGTFERNRDAGSADLLLARASQ